MSSTAPLGVRILKSLRVRTGRWRPELEQLASALRGVLERLGYEAGEPQISARSAYARLRILFNGPSEAFDLLLHAARPGMVHRHVAGYARQNPSALPHDRDLLNRVLQAVARNEEPLPVLEIVWRFSWPRLVGVLPFRPSGELVGVVFDRVSGRTSSRSDRSMCRVAILARGAAWIHLLSLVRSVVPPGPQMLKYRESGRGDDR
jgi:hypothetical protein